MMIENKTNTVENVNEKEVNAFYEFIMREIYSHLNKGGKAMIAYLYAFNVSKLNLSIL